MAIGVAPNESAIFTALRGFLTAVLPSTTKIFQGQGNRVSEPAESDFVIFTPIRRPRISTNVDTPEDVAFTASIAATVMTVTDIDFGTIELGSTVFGENVTADTVISLQLSGPTGGAGTYRVSKSQTIASQDMSAGSIDIQQATQIVVQIDVHGPLSADNAQVITTLFRDDYAVRKFEELGDVAVPLYADEPRQLPFHDGEQQVENRWVFEASMQANEVVNVPQQFAGVVDIELVDVDAVYPPS